MYWSSSITLCSWGNWNKLWTRTSWLMWNLPDMNLAFKVHCKFEYLTVSQGQKNHPNTCLVNSLAKYIWWCLKSCGQHLSFKKQEQQIWKLTGGIWTIRGRLTEIKTCKNDIITMITINHVIRSNWELGTQRNERNEMAMVGHTLRKDIGNTRYASMFKKLGGKRRQCWPKITWKDLTSAYLSLSEVQNSRRHGTRTNRRKTMKALWLHGTKKIYGEIWMCRLF